VVGRIIPIIGVAAGGREGAGRDFSRILEKILTPYGE
jgi:hypothetical protein